MTTPAQIESNRQNAKRSTGPKTSQGKAKSRLNAVRHGIFACEVLLPDEDPAELQALADRMRAELRPRGELEELHMGRAVAAAWRLLRLTRIEAGMLVHGLSVERINIARRQQQRYVSHPVEDGIRVLTAAGSQVMNPDEYFACEAAVIEAEGEGRTDLAAWGRAFISDATGPDAFARLARYETSVERSFYRSLQELERLRLARLGDTGNEVSEADGSHAE